MVRNEKNNENSPPHPSSFLGVSLPLYENNWGKGNTNQIQPLLHPSQNSTVQFELIQRTKKPATVLGWNIHAFLSCTQKTLRTQNYIRKQIFKNLFIRFISHFYHDQLPRPKQLTSTCKPFFPKTPVGRELHKSIGTHDRV